MARSVPLRGSRRSSPVAQFLVVRHHSHTMKLPLILFICATVFLSACSTQPKENYQQAYEQSFADGSVAMTTLQALDTGDIRKTRRVAMTGLHMTLDELSYLDAHLHPTPEQKQEEVKLAREVLDYMLAHRDDFDSRLLSVRAGMRGLQKILTEPDDVRRFTELSDYLAEVEKKMSETQKP